MGTAQYEIDRHLLHFKYFTEGAKKRQKRSSAECVSFLRATIECEWKRKSADGGGLRIGWNIYRWCAHKREREQGLPTRRKRQGCVSYQLIWFQFRPPPAVVDRVKTLSDLLRYFLQSRMGLLVQCANLFNCRVKENKPDYRVCWEWCKHFRLVRCEADVRFVELRIQEATDRIK